MGEAGERVPEEPQAVRVQEALEQAVRVQEALEQAVREVELEALREVERVADRGAEGPRAQAGFPDRQSKE